MNKTIFRSGLIERKFWKNENLIILLSDTFTGLYAYKTQISNLMLLFAQIFIIKMQVFLFQ